MTDISFFLLLADGGILGSISKALQVVLGLGLVIFFHELGHFAVAKWCNVHVERFSIGIGPIFWSRQKGETEYALSALPLGGYVKMLGQDDMDPNQMTSEEIAENPRSYSAKKVWQRMLIISAGVIMNVVTGFGFFAVAYRLGVVEVVPIVGYVKPGSPAWEAGIRGGDLIRSINDDEIREFGDIQQAVALSSGDLTIRVTRSDQEDHAFHVSPRLGKRTREVGIGPTGSLRISPEAGNEFPLVAPGLPASEASPPFLAGDRVVALNGNALDSFHQLSMMEAGLAAEELIYSVERESGDSSPGQTVEIRVPPSPVRSIGLWMSIGPIESIRRDSIAEQQGLKEGDTIREVDDLVVGEDIDPLFLPNFFADRAGRPVRVTVIRQGDSTIGEEKFELEIVPSDKPGWSEVPRSPDVPLPIPAIGAAIRIMPVISKVVAGSEAARSGRFQVRQRVTKVSLSYSGEDDILGDAKDDAYIIDLDKVDEPNWAYAFLQIQQASLRKIHLEIQETKDQHGFGVELQKRENESNWFMPNRGISGFETLSRIRTAESTVGAVELGMRRTYSSIMNICMTLRSLVRGDLSAKALSGPLGILSIGYQVADIGTALLLLFLGFLSINLAVLNFLPIPVLDGGHMVFLIWEGVTRRKPSPTIIGWAHLAGLLFILFLFLFVLYLDVFVRFLGFDGG